MAAITYPLGDTQRQTLEVLTHDWQSTGTIARTVFPADIFTQNCYPQMLKTLKRLLQRGMVERKKRTFSAKPQSRRGSRGKRRARKFQWYWRLVDSVPMSKKLLAEDEAKVKAEEKKFFKSIQFISRSLEKCGDITLAGAAEILGWCEEQTKDTLDYLLAGWKFELLDIGIKVSKTES